MPKRFTIQAYHENQSNVLPIDPACTICIGDFLPISVGDLVSQFLDLQRRVAELEAAGTLSWDIAKGVSKTLRRQGLA